MQESYQLCLMTMLLLLCLDVFFIRYMSSMPEARWSCSHPGVDSLIFSYFLSIKLMSASRADVRWAALMPGGPEELVLLKFSAIWLTLA